MSSDETLQAIADYEDEDATDEDRDRGRFAPTILQALAFAAAVAFLTSVVTAWWVTRDPTPNATDVGFYDDMTTHHNQAIGMAITYLRYGNDPVLSFVAGEINVNQNGDIRQMQAAMQQWRKEGTPGVAMEWMGMSVPQDAQPGMATNAQLAALKKARGRELDDMFSRLMMTHHNGGIHMAEAAAKGGDLSRNIAANMAALQRSEVGEMGLRREQLGLPSFRP